MNFFKLQIQKSTIARTLWGLFFISFSSVCGHSFEFRSTPTLDKGPYRTLDEAESSNWSARHWASFYGMDAQKAFSEKHGVTTQDIAALYLGKSNFRVTEMFPDLYVSEKTEFYNPLLRTARMELSSRYSEMGIVMGGSWDMPVVGKTGRLGMRFKVPFKKIKVEKNDTGNVRMGAQLENVLSVQIGGGQGSSGSTVTSAVDNKLVLVRMDFAEALVQSSARNPALIMKKDAATPNVRIGAVSDVCCLNGSGLSIVPGATNAKVGIVNSPEGLIPDQSIRNVLRTTEITGAKNSYDDIVNLSGSSFAVFKQNVDYSKLAEFEDKSLADRQAAQEVKANTWLIPVVSGDGKVSSADQNGVLGNLESLSGQVTENVAEWLHDRGLDFESFTDEGVGDIDCDFFFNNVFNDTLTGEVFVGFRAPTGGKSKYSSNPYKTNLGNGGHWEVNFGGKGTFAPSNHFIFTGDARYAFVLGHVEERHAPFRNANVKLGPKVDVDVKWEYFVGNLNMNIVHFWSRDISAVLGYEIYYKRTDKVVFNDAKVSTWLGKKRNDTTGKFELYEMPLDEALATKNTNSVSHKLKAEFSFVMTDWMEFYGGASYVFAGRNTLRATDAHFGFNIAF